MNIKKFLALIMALICICSFAACNSGGADGNSEENTSLEMEDGEDVGIKRSKVTVANITGKDAVSLLARKSGSTEWSDNILSQDFLHTDKAVEITYTVSDNNVYDLRLVFEDESYQDFKSIDFSSGQPIYYLGKNK